MINLEDIKAKLKKAEASSDTRDWSIVAKEVPAMIDEIVRLRKELHDMQEVAVGWIEDTFDDD